jgi:hypothetical protein
MGHMKEELIFNKIQEQKIYRSVPFIVSLGTANLSHRRPVTTETSWTATVLRDTIIKVNNQYSNTEIIIVKEWKISGRHI